MALKYYNGSTWVTFRPVYYNIVGVEPRVHYWNGSSWVVVHDPLVVDVAATKSITDLAFSGVAYAYVQVDSDGDLKSSTTSSTLTTVYETYLDGGSNTQVWVEAVKFSGDTPAGTLNTRLACTSDRTWGLSQSTVGIKTCVLDLNFYDASSGGTLLDSQRVTLTAERDEL